MNSEKCVHRYPDGSRCGRYPIRGATVCKSHGGGAKQIRAKAAVRAEVMAWGLGDVNVNPAVTLLQLIAQSKARVELYSGLLKELYAKADAGEGEATLPARVGVLIGRKFVLGNEGRPVPVEEAIRGLVELDGVERDRLARFCGIAINAGLEAERIAAVKHVEEQMGGQIAEIIRAVVLAPQVGLSEAQRVAVLSGLRAQLGLVPELEAGRTHPTPAAGHGLESHTSVG